MEEVLNYSFVKTVKVINRFSSFLAPGGLELSLFCQARGFAFHCVNKRCFSVSLFSTSYNIRSFSIPRAVNTFIMAPTGNNGAAAAPLAAKQIFVKEP